MSEEAKAARLKQPAKGWRPEVVHAPRGGMAWTMCWTAVGRSWTVVARPVTCRVCLLRMEQEGTP